jgi:phosphohistidine swiveling domain-containing protein
LALEEEAEMNPLDAENHDGGAAMHPEVLGLTDARARIPDLVGAKAANLAEASSSGHPVLDGFVITTAGVRGWLTSGATRAVRDTWTELSDAGRAPVVVRSSSTIEDAEQSSQAGRFKSVLRVVGWSSFADAVQEVIASADDAGIQAPIAVLVQPWLDATRGGVAFGRDPVTGANHIVVSTVVGGPHTLVSGAEQGATLRMNRRGRVARRTAGTDPSSLPRSDRRALAKLVTALGRQFDAPQDVEWATDGEGRLWLLQTRPITATGTAASGPALGPGPIAETFPEQLAPLEEDLWLDPLREGLVEALALSGARSRAHIERSPVLVSVGGRPAVDLDLIGAGPAKRRWWRALDPRPGARRVNAAWRVGRLRAALPELAENVILDVDSALFDVPGLAHLEDEQLVRVLRNAHDVLRSLHGHEVLMGMLLPDESAPSIATAALAAVRKGRASARSDNEIIERHPVVLSLVPPQVGPPAELPEVGESGRDDAPTSTTDRSAMLREAIRLRARWVHELTARAAWELAQRLDERGHLHGASCVRQLRLDELEQLVEGGAPPSAWRDRMTVETPSLPAAFRLRQDGGLVALDTDAIAIGAGGGRAEGTVYIGDDPPPGSVLVVDNLSPRLASMLPDLRGLIAETGSPLSHVAILARELGIATVVAYPDALNVFVPGDSVVVDGATGEVTQNGHGSGMGRPSAMAAMREASS